ncbi:hypothetical protein MUN84_22015 [Hymenobacter sp. 5516J-16]|uniref:hypothetical protein n=1 Tax=Hymenobacter sp. 5516J-16 TaxID=2932253 RepID=UPI001FD144AE|nr:hypothetical protein [Hymenobacter sp. 5516J-16]UOQ77094.1 hypothetical protein MUN84_22015 [Hymenobacter sp. 5516J-16]
MLVEFPWHLSLLEFALHLTPVLMMSLLIRYNAQRWLREPHEAGLHLVGGLLRTSTWWIYCLGFVYTLLRVRVPYIPTPKEGHGRNEWLLSLPNLVLAGICVAAARYGHYLTQTPYALLMMALALTNAALLFASVLMAQHELLKRLRQLATSARPLRWLLRQAENFLENQVGPRLLRLRTAAVFVAFFVFTTHSLISLGISLWLGRNTPSDALIWAHTGVGGVRIGQAATPPMSPMWTASVTAGTKAAPAVVELQLPPALGPHVTAATLAALDQQGSTPLLSWEVTGSRFQADAWQRSVATIRERNKPVLLRPLLRARTPAAYRKAWRELVTRFRAAGDTSAAWVWTPLVLIR